MTGKIFNRPALRCSVCSAIRPSIANNDPYEFDFGAPSTTMPIEPLMAPVMPVSDGFVDLDSMLLEMLPAATNHNVPELSPGLLQGL